MRYKRLQIAASTNSGFRVIPRCSQKSSASTAVRAASAVAQFGQAHDGDAGRSSDGSATHTAWRLIRAAMMTDEAEQLLCRMWRADARERRTQSAVSAGLDRRGKRAVSGRFVTHDRAQNPRLRDASGLPLVTSSSEIWGKRAARLNTISPGMTQLGSWPFAPYAEQ